MYNCSIQGLVAPNGATSLLFENILKHNNGDVPKSLEDYIRINKMAESNQYYPLDENGQVDSDFAIDLLNTNYLGEPIPSNDAISEEVNKLLNTFCTKKDATATNIANDEIKGKPGYTDSRLENTINPNLITEDTRLINLSNDLMPLKGKIYDLMDKFGFNDRTSVSFTRFMEFVDSNQELFSKSDLSLISQNVAKMNNKLQDIIRGKHRTLLPVKIGTTIEEFKKLTGEFKSPLASVNRQDNFKYLDNLKKIATNKLGSSFLGKSSARQISEDLNYMFAGEHPSIYLGLSSRFKKDSNGVIKMVLPFQDSPVQEFLLKDDGRGIMRLDAVNDFILEPLITAIANDNIDGAVLVLTGLMKYLTLNGNTGIMLPAEYGKIADKAFGKDTSYYVEEEGTNHKLAFIPTSSRFTYDFLGDQMPHKKGIIDDHFLRMYAKHDSNKAEAEKEYLYVNSERFKTDYGHWDIYNKLLVGEELDEKQKAIFDTLYDGDLNELQNKVEEFYDPVEKEFTIPKDVYKTNIPDRDLSKYPALGVKNITNEVLNTLVGNLSNRFGVDVEVLNNSTLPYSGKLENGTIYINAANATLNTALHEFSHLLAISAVRDEEFINTIKKPLSRSSYYEQALTEYSDFDTNVIMEEALVNMIADRAEAKLRNDNIFSMFYNWLVDSFKGIADLATLDFDNIKLRSIVDHMSDELLYSKDVRQKMADIIDVVRYQRVPNNNITKDITGLTELLTGNMDETVDNNIDRRVNILSKSNFNEKWQTEGWFLSERDKKLYESDKTKFGDRKLTVPKNILSPLEFKNHIREYLEKMYSKRSVDRVNFLVNGLNAKQFESDYEYDNPSPMFRSSGEDIGLKSFAFKYEKLKDSPYKDLYVPELDDKNLIVIVHSEIDKDNPDNLKPSFELLYATDEKIDNKGLDKSLFDGIKNKINNVNGLNIKYTRYNELSLKLMMYSMMFKSKGYNVRDSAIYSSDATIYPSDENSVYYNYGRRLGVMPGNILPEMKKVFDTPFMKQSIKAGNSSDIYNIFYDSKGNIKEEAFDSKQYYYNYLDKLVTMYKTFESGSVSNSGMNDTLNSAINVLKNPKDVNSYMNLEKAAIQRLTYLHSIRNDNFKKKAEVKFDEEYIMLSGLLQELQSPIHRSSNKMDDMGTIEKYITSLNGISNPYIAWWVREFKKAKVRMNEEIFKDIKENKGAFEKFVANYNNKNMVSGVSNKIFVEETQYYDRIIAKQKIPTGEGDKMVEVYTNRLLRPGESEYDALDSREKEYIEHLMNMIREKFIKHAAEHWSEDYFNKMSYDRQNDFENMDADEKARRIAEEIYDSSPAAQGFLPIMKARPGELAAKGQFKDGADRFMELLSSDAYYIDSNQELDKIPAFMFDRLRSMESYNRALGLSSDGMIDDLDKFNESQKFISRNVHDNMNMLMYQARQNEYMSHLPVLWKSADALIKQAERGNHLIGDEVEVSNAVQLLDAIGNKLLFRKTAVIGDDETSKNLTKILSGLMMATSFGTLGFNTVSNIANFTSMMANIVVRDTSERSAAGKTFEDNMLAEATSFIKNLSDDKKMWEIGRRVGAVHQDAYDALNVRRLTGSPTSLIDSKNTFIVDQLGDEVLSLWQTYVQMKRDGVWDAWEFNEKTGELTYNESKDKRDKKIKELVRDNLIKEGILQPDSESNTYSPYDLNLRLNLERKITRAMGGYKEGNQTMAGMVVLGKTVGQFRKYMYMHLENTFKQTTHNPSAIQYEIDKLTGDVKLNPSVEEGTYQSLLTTVQQLGKYRNMSTSEWIDFMKNDINHVQKENLVRVLWFAGSAILAQSAYMLFLMEDDDKMNWATGRINKYDGFIARIYLATINELNAINSIQSKIDVLSNPLTFMGMVETMWNLTTSALTLDADKTWKTTKSKIGVFKTGNTAYEALMEEEEKG